MTIHHSYEEIVTLQAAQMTWAIVTGEYPPQPGGVSGYTWVVANALADAGDNVHVFAPGRGLDEWPSRVHVHRLSDCFGTQGRRELAAGVAALPAPRRLLLQFVLQSFGMRAVNYPFIHSLKQFRGYPLWIMFHEFALDDTPSESFPRRAQAYITRRLARMAAASADVAFVSTPAWTPLIRAAAPDTPVHWMPIPSNIETHADPAATAAIRSHYQPAAGSPLVGHFGSYRMKDGRRFLQEAIPAIAAVSPERRVLLLGRGSDAFAAELIAADERLAGRIFGTGDLESHEVAAHLAACDLLLQPYSDGATTRRGSLFAGLALGVPCVTTLGSLSEALWATSDAAFFAPPNDVAATLAVVESALADSDARLRVGRNARALYMGRFDIAHTVAQLRQQ